MSRQNLIAIALGTVALSVFPLAYANAQSGDALANAENTCMENGVAPNTAAFDTCVSRSALDYDRGRPGMATQQAEAVRDANDVCQSYGIASDSLGYRQCVDAQVNHRTAPRTAQAYSVETPHATASVDSFGFHYDRQGNVLDKDGYVIRPVPY